MEKKLIPFNLERALAGDKVVLSDGTQVKIAGHNPACLAVYNKLCGWVMKGDNMLHAWSEEGRASVHNSDMGDLFMAEEEKPKPIEQNNLKPFDFDKVILGDKVITRDGREVKIAGRDLNAKEKYVIVGWISGVVHAWGATGRFVKTVDSPLDLFMAPKERTVWVNLYDKGTGSYHSKESFADAHHAQVGIAFGDRLGNKAHKITFEE